jgi:hypothetical protein
MAVRYYFLLPHARWEIVLKKKSGIYLILFASLLMMAAALFPDMKLPEDRKK